MRAVPWPIPTTDHRHVKRRLRVMQGPRARATAWAAIQGIEAVPIIRKGQVPGLHGGTYLAGLALPHLTGPRIVEFQDNPPASGPNSADATLPAAGKAFLTPSSVATQAPLRLAALTSSTTRGGCKFGLEFMQMPTTPVTVLRLHGFIEAATELEKGGWRAARVASRAKTCPKGHSLCSHGLSALDSAIVPPKKPDPSSTPVRAIAPGYSRWRGFNPPNRYLGPPDRERKTS